MAGNRATQRWINIQMPDKFGEGNIRNIDNHYPSIAIAEIGPIPLRVRRSMEAK
jgi:hypothetical protein